MDGKYQLDCLKGLQSSQKFLAEYSECREAERQYHETTTGATDCVKESNRNRKDSDKTHSQGNAMPKSSLACEIANVREKIKTFLKNGEKKSPEVICESLGERLVEFTQQYDDLKSTLQKTTGTLNALAEKFEVISTQFNKLPFKIVVQPNGEVQFILKDSSNVNIVATPPKQEVKNSPKVDCEGTKEEDDDDIDLFGSDEETEEEAKLKAERLKAYENKKSKKPALVAKSSVVLDVKPWDDETDMKELEAAVRKIETDGLKWGAGKLVPLAYGIKKLQIVCIVEDDKVSIDWLQETIQEIEDLVQSVDIAAFNKL